MQSTRLSRSAAALLLALLLLPATALAANPRHAHRACHRGHCRPLRHVTKRHHVKRHSVTRHHVPRAHVAVGSRVLPVRRAAVITGTTYYVSPSGSDSNSGTSPAQAWKTVGKVNGATLHPGDGVLFEGGQSFGDNTLMPTQSGTAGAPIVFGSYGTGQATLTTGAWFIDKDYLTFDNLQLGPANGLQGGNDSGHTANHITVQRCTVNFGAGAPANANVGIYQNGSDWTIAGNTIENIGNSGMLLNGSDDTITGNTITHVGLNRGISYDKHGIYLKVANATVTNNNISYFQAAGISPRFRNSTIANNTIAHGAIGISFFQYDTVSADSHWSANNIADTTAGAIYVSTGDPATPTIESFTITSNTIHIASGDTLNLHHTRGHYQVSDNTIH